MHMCLNTETICPNNRHGTGAQSPECIFVLIWTSSKSKQPQIKALCTLAVKCVQRATISIAHCCQHDCTGQHLSFCDTHVLALVLACSLKRTHFLKWKIEPFVFPLFYRHLVCRSQWRQTSFSLCVPTLSTSCSSPYCTLLLDSVLLTLLLDALSLSEGSIVGSSINAKPAITVRVASEALRSAL